MYHLELADLEIFHKLCFPERSPYFLSTTLPNSLFSSQYSLIPVSFPRQHTRKPDIYTDQNKILREGKDNGFYEADVYDETKRKEMAISSTSPFLFHFPVKGT